MVLLRSRRMRAPFTVWVLIIAYSSAVRRPGLLRISVGITILPRSCRADAVLMSEMSLSSS